MNAPSRYSPQEKKRIFIVVFVTIFLDMVGFGLVFPLLPFYIQRLGGSAQTVGLLLTSFAAIQLVTSPLMGRLSDTYGRRRVILISLIGNAASMVLFALADQLWMIFLSRLLAGATAGNMGACQAVIADITDREERAKGMGRMGAGIGMGMVMGPLIGGELARFGMWAPATVAAVAALVDLVLAWAWMPETHPAFAGGAGALPGKGAAAGQGAGDGAAASTNGPSTASSSVSAARQPTVWEALQEPSLLKVMAITFLVFLCLSQLQVSMALLAKERLGWGEIQTGRLFGLFGFIALVVQGGLLSPMVKALGEVRLSLVGSVCVLAGMVLVAFGYSALALVAGQAVVGFGFSIANPINATLASRFAPKSMQGVVLGFVQSSGGLARAIGPTVGGLAFNAFGSGSPFLGGAVAAGISCLLVLSLLGEEGRSSKSA